MSIKLKLALPTLLGLALIIILIQYLWRPLQLDDAEVAFKKHTQELLISSEAGVIQHLLDRDLGSLFSLMEQLEKSYRNRWLNVTLYNENGKKIYPIIKDTEDHNVHDEYLIHVIYPLRIEGTDLGRIELDANWRIERNIVIKNLNDVRDMTIAMLLLAMLITAISQYKTIYRPLKKLIEATNKIKHGNFDTELPDFTNDEIGELAKSFDSMRVELEFQENALNEHAIVSIADRDGVITCVNKKLVDISGYAAEELIGKNHRIFNSGTHSQAFFEELWRTITHGKVWHGDICNMKKNGEKFWVNSTIVPFPDEKGVPKRYMTIRTDISEQKNAEEQLRYMANHDILTGLPTRRLGEESLSMALARARRDSTRVAVLFLDLDGFKEVNDSMGHDAGDFLLVNVSRRLKDCVREADTVVRLGGDEFIVIISDVEKREDAGLVAQRMIDALGSAFTINNRDLFITASIGIAIYPDNEKTPEGLLKCADDVMYAVKRKGKNRYAFYGDL